MKTLSTILMAVVMIAAFMAPLALAEDDSNDSSDAIALYNDTSDLPEDIVISPAPTSDDEVEQEAEEDMNESASGLRIGLLQIRNAFTFNQEKKAQLELQLAKLRLIQAKIAAKNNNTNAMEKALEAHERIMERVKERVGKIEDSGDASESAEKLRGLERAIQVHERRISILNDILANENLTDEVRARIEAKISQMQNVTAKLAELNAARKAKITTKLMAIANLTEEEAKALLESGGLKIKAKIKEKLGEVESETEIEIESEDENETEIESEDEDDDEDEDSGNGSGNGQSGQDDEED